MKKLEIERKFLFKPECELMLLYREGISTRQAYFSADSSIRVRHTNTKSTITYKGAGDISREEIETEINSEDASRFILAAPFKILKTRYELYEDTDKWEVDVFIGKHSGLILVECEIPRVDYELKIPFWVGQEVTYDKRYSNHSIAVNGIPE